MRALIAGLLLAVALPALAAFDVTATMPPTTGTPQGCQLYLDGNKAGAVRPCGSPQLYAGLLTTDGTYSFRYTVVRANGTETVQSPARTVTVTTTVQPPNSAPTLTVVCNPSPCPEITITIAP